ncbi:non-canonical poly(A) RNA polymerase PAPD5 [Nephila pilipes]|uniref:Non-canonical poly(A) RNA polymerase PAPD5 n=1 Tax=Nephila pilipes TaxID=299642 RepID=A0A8X6NTL5_NEPPI|nr:non-canonical poly(A) RNA polymerase PAPD5 [Nephila pilipes]
MMENSPKYSEASYIPVSINREPDFRRNRTYKNNSRTFLGRCCDVEDSDAIWKRNTSPYTHGIIGLHEEMVDFYEVMRPKEQETELRLKVIEHITWVVHSLWPLAQVSLY